MRLQAGNHRPLRAAGALLIFVGAWMLPRSAGPCSPYLTSATTGISEPGPPIARFVAGELGLLEPSQQLSVLLIAYRYLTGNPLDTEAQVEVARYWTEQPPYYPKRRQPVDSAFGLSAQSASSMSDPDDPWGRPKLSLAWDLALDRWLGLLSWSPQGIYPSRAAPIQPYLLLTRPQGDLAFESRSLNCAQDAFESAARALAERARLYGSGSREVSEWVRGQQMVFRSCNGSGQIPEPLDSSWPQTLRFDREYQIAAAHFYRREPEEAVTRFRAIASEPRSPWQKIARYLVARTLIRSGRATEAARELLGLLGDPALGEAREPANWLLVRCLRTLSNWSDWSDPDSREVLVEARRESLRWLTSQLFHPKSSVGMAQALDDLSRNSDWRGLAVEESTPDLVAFDRWLERLGYTGPSKPKRPRPARKLALELDLPEESNDLAGLVAIAISASPEAREAPELLARIDRIPKSSPAWPTLQFHASRILAARGQNEAARQALNLTVANLTRLEDVSGANAARDLRGRTAASLAEFLVDAEQRAALFWVDGHEFGRCSNPEGHDDAFGCGDDLMLSDFAKHYLEDRVAAARTLEAIQAAPTIRQPLASRLLLSAFARAVLAEEEESAMRISQELVSRSVLPDSVFGTWREESDPERRRARSLLILLRNPGFSPFAADSRLDTGRYDDSSKNWWCSGQKADPPTEALSLERGWPAFERSPLEFQPATVVLGNWFLAYSRRHPDDPIVPEVLAGVVRLTRHGCRQSVDPPDRIGSISKAAFDLLHQRYASSDWANQTPYWYE